MIAYRFKNGALLDLDEKTYIQIAVVNPLFSFGKIEGDKVYSFKALRTASNQKNLGFPEKLNLIDKKQVIDGVDLYLHGLLWRRGALRVRKSSPDGYDLSFHIDSGSLAVAIHNRRIRDMDLGSEPLNRSVNRDSYYPTVNHVLFPVYNPGFYENNPQYHPVVNEYEGRLMTNSQAHKRKYTVCPFPYLLHVLKQLFKALGYYDVTGAWTTREYTRRIVIVNNVSLDYHNNFGVNVWLDTVRFSNHLPDMSIGDFLITVSQFFGILYQVNELENTVNIVTIHDVLKDRRYMEVVDYSEKYSVEPVAYDGMSFEMKADSGDEALKENGEWLKYKVGNGAQKLKVNASPLNMIINNGREMPYMNQKGVSLSARQYLYEISDLQNSSADQTIFYLGGLRFMLFSGIAFDSQGREYPVGGIVTQTNDWPFSGEKSILWRHPRLGIHPKGIVKRLYQSYMDFMQYSERVRMKISLKSPDFFRLNIQRKLMIGGVKYLIKSYKTRVSKDEGVKTLDVELFKINN